MESNVFTPAAGRPVTEVVAGIRAGGRALVALSGGVDSAVVAALATRALGPDAVAVTLVGPAVARAEVRAAEAVAGEIGIAHRLVVADPLESPEYRSNPVNRCYFCRVVETRALLRLGERIRARQYLDGVHLDDLRDDRPGIRAMDAAGFRHPLVDARWTKADVRAFARSLLLSVADRPSNACLSSRVRHGTPISRPLLRLIEEAEATVAAHGFERVRVRYDGRRAQVVVGASEVDRLVAEPLASRLRRELGTLGLANVDLDSQGYSPHTPR